MKEKILQATGYGGNEQGEEKRSPLLLIILLAATVVATWLFRYYQEHPYDFPWGQAVYTVNVEDLNLLPNEQTNYLGTRLSQDADAQYVYHTDKRSMTAAAAFSIRTGPGVYYQSVGRMYYGRQVQVLATSDDNDWYIIDLYTPRVSLTSFPSWHRTVP